MGLGGTAARVGGGLGIILVCALGGVGGAIFGASLALREFFAWVYPNGTGAPGPEIFPALLLVLPGGFIAGAAIGASCAWLSVFAAGRAVRLALGGRGQPSDDSTASRRSTSSAVE